MSSNDCGRETGDGGAELPEATEPGEVEDGGTKGCARGWAEETASGTGEDNAEGSGDDAGATLPGESYKAAGAFVFFSNLSYILP